MDVANSAARTDTAKVRLRRVLYEVFENALHTTGIDDDLRDPLVDLGDGILAIIHPTVPKTLLLNTFVSALGERLTRRCDLRLRVVVYAGEVLYDRRGRCGEALQGLQSLTVAERAEFYARAALGLHHAGNSTAAMEMLNLAADSATIMARRGELAAFDRPCEALVEILPPNEAALAWAPWLQAAAQSDSYHALGLIASYIRWIPAADMARIVIDPETGDLKQQSS